ncbi:hemolysin III family protein [Elusimicrobiota bacterium]
MQEQNAESIGIPNESATQTGDPGGHASPVTVSPGKRLQLEEKPAAAEEPHPEIWSAVLSALGAVVSIPAIAALVMRAPSDPWHTWSISLYGLGLVSMFSASAVYHWCGGTEESAPTMRKLDYCAIGLMIAGGFTPYILLGMRTTFGLSLLGVIWAIAALAIGVIALRPKFSKWSFIALYLLMGWLGLFIFIPLSHVIGWEGVGLTLLGGVIYSIGAVVFNSGGTLPTPLTFAEHEIWHLCILAGAGIHFWVFYAYLLP